VVVVTLDGVTTTTGGLASSWAGPPGPDSPVAMNVDEPGEPGAWAASYSKETTVPGSRFAAGTVITGPETDTGPSAEATKP
jgi:hypothetical protein